MRSRKDSPGLAVMRTMMRSDTTRVPPVTAERSPPDSRMTGADSPVMADSSTVAMPSMTSPSPGMTSPASHHHQVAGPQAGGRHLPASAVASTPATFLATVSVLVLRKLIGLGLAAAFGHRLGEVGEQHGEPQPGGDLADHQRVWSPPERDVAGEQHGGQQGDDAGGEHHRVAAPASRGSSLRKESIDGRRVMIAGSNSEIASGRWMLMGLPSEQGAGGEQQLLDDRAQGEDGEEGQAADHDDDARSSRPTNSQPWVGKVPADGGTIFLATNEPAMARVGMITRKRPINMAKPSMVL